MTTRRLSALIGAVDFVVRQTNPFRCSSKNRYSMDLCARSHILSSPTRPPAHTSLSCSIAVLSSFLVVCFGVPSALFAQVAPFDVANRSMGFLHRHAPSQDGADLDSAKGDEASDQSSVDQSSTTDSSSPDEGARADDPKTSDAPRASGDNPTSDDNAASDVIVTKPLDGFLIQVPLPITQEVDTQVRRMIGRVLDRLPQAATSKDRPVLVLEFDTANGASGEASQLERCLALARYLTGPELRKVRTVAYIPAHRGIRSSDDEKPTSRLVGHAVLIAIACEELIMHDDAVIGAAGIDESQIDGLLEVAYLTIAEQRLTLPPPFVMGLLDKQRSLVRVTTNDGVLYLSEQELSDLARQGEVTIVGEDTISERGSLPEFTSEEMLGMQLIDHRVSNRLELARRINVKEEALQGDPSLGEEWRPVMIKFTGPIQQQDVNWAVTAIQRAVDMEGRNLIVVELDSTGGSVGDAMRVAQQLASFDETKVRSIAYVPKRVRGGAAMIALACDHLVMHADATIGGPADPEILPEEVEELRATLEALADERGRDWSVFASVLDPTLTLYRYRNIRTGQVRLMLEDEREELEDPEQWAAQGEVDTREGITGITAEQFLIAKYLAANFAEVKAFYQLSEEPELLEPTLAHRWVEDLGRQLASPWIAGWLLFGAMFFLSTELSQPGVSVPGFLSAVCFFLFFWSQYCDGNVQLFEILLLVVGSLFIVLEIFVLPGFGVFGVGGILMIIASLFLAMQSFVIPTSSSDVRQLPGSVAVVVAGFAGVFVAMALIRRLLPHVPVFNRMILAPPEPEAPMAPSGQATGSYSELLDEVGTTVTSLSPAGKIRIGKRLVDVVTDGRFIEKDEPIVVTEVHGNRILVMPVDLGRPKEA